MGLTGLELRVDRDGDTSLTEQVRRSLESAIASGEFPANARIPSERALCDRFGVSRMTIRAALQELAISGAIHASRGRGTFVAEKKVEQPLRGLTSFTEDVRNRGQHPTSRLIETVVVPAPLDLAHVFGVGAGAPLVRVTRVRLADDLALAIETTHVLQRLCPGLEAHDFGQESLYATLRDVYRITPASARQTIEAATPTPEERNLLDLPPHTPVLRMSRVTQLHDGTVVEFVRATYRGDRYLLTVELR